MCARAACGNLKDTRPWCSECEKHVNDAVDHYNEEHK